MPVRFQLRLMADEACSVYTFNSTACVEGLFRCVCETSEYSRLRESFKIDRTQRKQQTPDTKVVENTLFPNCTMLQNNRK